MSQRHWIIGAPRPRATMSVPVAEILAWRDRPALSALAAHFGLSVDASAGGVDVLPDYELAQLEQIMQERPKPGRGGEGAPAS